ncbi:MAG: hypothetical protein DSM106950_28715 [Stigonema ocellatum SAG 48.90 = DSM 106950]|nr:hypothetical protein [Stigonema ocellatum SAG 48.90 = DSM 106950]
MSNLPDDFLEKIAAEQKITEAEMEALRLVLSGLTAEGVASELGISAPAVRKRLGSVYLKFGIQGKVRGQLERLKAHLIEKYQLTQSQRDAPKVDWGVAPDVSIFYGRENELAELEEWIVSDRCKLVAIHSVAGMGKTALSVQLLKQTKTKFNFIIWRSLRNATKLHILLKDLLKSLTAQDIEISPEVESIANAISQLINFMNKHRCFLVLDNFDSLLKSDELTGQYWEAYENYGELLTRIGQQFHQSCLLLTCREIPKNVTLIAGEPPLPVRIFKLPGLDLAAAQELLTTKGLLALDEAFPELVKRYNGNPLELKIAASTIKEVFDNDIAKFLEQGQVSNVLHQQFERLTEPEAEILYRLAIYCSPVSLPELQDDIHDEIAPALKQKVTRLIESLKQRSLIDKNRSHYDLHEYIREEVTAKVAQKIYQAIKDFESEEKEAVATSILNRLPLIKVTAEESDIRNQQRYVIKPVLQKLISEFGSIESVEQNLNAVLEKLRSIKPSLKGYAGGNILNLLCGLEIDISHKNYSELTIWQAYLKGRSLRGTNFSKSDLSGCVFSELLGSVTTVAYHSGRDLLAVGDADGRVRVWQLRDWQLLHNFKGHSGWVWALAFAPNGEVLVSTSADRTVKLWNVRTRRGGILESFEEHTSSVRTVAFSWDGQFFATASEDEQVIVWDDNYLPVARLPGYSVAFAQNKEGPILATAGAHNPTIQIWQWNGNQFVPLKNPIKGHAEAVLCLAFSSDSLLLVSGSLDKTIKLWQVNSGECLQDWKGHQGAVQAILFSRDGQTVVSGSSDSTINLWNIYTALPAVTIRNHKDQVLSLALGPDQRTEDDQGYEQTLISGGDDKTLKLYRVEFASDKQAIKGYKLSKSLEGCTSWIWSVAFNGNGKVLVAGCDDHTVKLWVWDSLLNRWKYSRSLEAHTDRVWSVMFSPDGRTLVSGSGDSTVKLWNVSTWECINTLNEHKGRVRSVAFSPNNKFIASGSADTNINLWNARTGQSLDLLEGHTDEVWSVAFSPDNKLIASASKDKTIKLWSVDKGTCVQTLEGHSNEVWCVAFSPTQNLLASGSGDKTVKLWDLVTGECLNTLSEHEAQVQTVAFSTDGKFLASGGNDSTIKLWDLTNLTLIKSFTRGEDQGHENWVWSVAFDPSQEPNTILASGSQDETIKLWNLKTLSHVQTLSSKPYEGMNISSVTGLDQAQLVVLKELGAVEI